MLKGIDPILNAEVLHALRAMGHGDDLILCDTNFPAQSVARRTVARPAPPHRRAAGAGGEGGALGLSARQLRRRRRRAHGDRRRPTSVPEVQREVQAEIDAAEGKSWPMVGIERYAFYERAKQAYASSRPASAASTAASRSARA